MIQTRYCRKCKAHHPKMQDGCISWPPVYRNSEVYAVATVPGLVPVSGVMEEPEIPRFGSTEFAEDWSL